MYLYKHARNTGKFLIVVFSEEDLFWGVLAASVVF